MRRNRVDLPVELERIVFESAARNDVGTALRLTRVAQRVKIWVEPILYSRVVVARANDPTIVDRPEFQRTKKQLAAAKAPKKAAVLPFIRTIACRPAEFFAQHVKVLHVAHLTVLELRTVLSTCTGIVELSWRQCTISKAIIALLNPLKLTRLSVDATYSPIHFPSPKLAQIHSAVTHLDLQFGSLVPNLHTLPALTHLCLASEAQQTQNWSATLFSQSPKLQIVLHLSTPAHWTTVMRRNQGQPLADPRLVVMLPPDAGSLPAHDLWPVTERIVRGRREIAAAEERKKSAEEAAAAAAQ
ncbi:hypothetical protein MKEN_00482700 [Mycena kentingensis (nom. inval.)]|nr:hypothetical protein MKEN_00482700 [Mycena kentingensis (nom. inval.)]